MKKINIGTSKFLFDEENRIVKIEQETQTSCFVYHDDTTVEEKIIQKAVPKKKRRYCYGH